MTQTRTTVPGQSCPEQDLPVEAQAPMDWQGKVLKGRYRIASLLGSGGMSDVYRATDLHLEEAGAKDAQVAVKILRSELTRDGNALGLLAKEAAKSKCLAHPNIIRVYDLDHDGDVWFMVMELLEGEPLSKVIQRAKPQGLKWKGAKAVLDQIIQALAYSHQRGIVHADLKPSNIFVTRQGSIKILDFGVAQALRPGHQEDFLNQSLGDETTVYGYTPAYASTSLIAGKEPQVEDDLYALACVSYELLSSRHPFDRQRLDEQQRKAFKLARPGNMPGRLWGCFRRLLKEEARRPSLAEIEKTTRPLPWAHLIYPLVVAAALGSAFYAWQQGGKEVAAAREELKAQSDHQAALAELSSRPVTQLLAGLGGFSPLERAGLLMSNRDRIIDHFGQKVDEALKAPARADLPNFPAAAKVLVEALSYFPNDDSLRTLEAQLNQRRLGLYNALAEELRARLVQGDFGSQGAVDELTGLKADLLFLGKQLPALGDQAITTYKGQMSAAIDQDDAPAIARLLAIGETFYGQEQGAADTIKAAKQQESAIAALANYDKAVAEGGTADYPVDAAEAFYARKIGVWNDGIAAAKDGQALDAVFEAEKAFAATLPVDLPSLKALRHNLANAYISQANDLIAHRRVVAAAPLMQRANELMSD
ncbi:serine/threonine-protein kinase [Gallaecimonas kandeliae]|uniref:serine/threonine-protein kinase n=1 Tax=Gallaecimonas kandeliae TaxID=3029055 RepID=UPI002648C8F2|nr:serine/threonine-protein kinase [Gallaecimonas kandeliae]WKE65750.1 serine/threonine-protein kinase [Gallaecimonas kandeliae]